jgi:hypothetical protein
MKHAVEMTSGDMVYMESFIKTGSDIQKLIQGAYTYRHTHTHTHSNTNKLISSAYFYFFKIMKVG